MPIIASLKRFVRRARAAWRRGTIDRELDSEIEHHIAMEAAELQRTRGVAPDEARRLAMVAFGGVSRFREDHRDARPLRWLDEVMQDMRFAARSLRRSAGFTVSSVLILALGIGSTTAVFSAVNAVVRDPQYDGLVMIRQQFSPTVRGTMSVVDYRAVEEQQQSFAAVGAMRWTEAAFAAGGDAERVSAGAATAGFFRALGIRPVVGRGIEPGDEAVGVTPVTLLTWRRAEQSFGSAAAAVGKAVTIDGVVHTVVGVLPQESVTLGGVRADAWKVLQLPQPERRGPFGYRVVGRLRDGVSIEGATRDLAAISERIFLLWASSFQNREARLTPTPMNEEILGPATRMLNVFAAAAGLVLLIAVANVASLMLVRAIGRGREVALRTVLGASKARLARLMVTESLALASAGALAGIIVGALGLRALVAYGPSMPHLFAAQLDLRAVAFAVAVALVVAVVIGAYPLVMLLARDATAAVQGGERTIGGGRRTHALRSAFVIAQFALALPLLAVAGLLLNSFLRLQQVDPGFDTRNLLTVRVSLPVGGYGNDSLVAGYWARALSLVAEASGVSEVGLGSSMPPDDFGSGDNNNFDLIDHPVSPGSTQPASHWPAANARYFDALGVRLLEGRLFTPSDTGGPAPVVVVSRSWAARYFPEGNVVGRRLVSGGCTSCPLTTVIGVVGDVRYDGLGRAPDAVYSPLSEGWPRNLHLFVRTSMPPELVAERVRDVLRGVDPSVPLDDIASMEERLYQSVAQPRNWAVLLGTFATAALVLAAVGIFGMLSYSVSTRRREIGVRMALGARRQAVVGMLVKRGVGHALAGTAVGIVAALLATRALAAWLFDVSPTDPATLAGVISILLAVGATASWLPARRAAAIDPVETMRTE